jgi:hypothetical protein
MPESKRIHPGILAGTGSLSLIPSSECFAARSEDALANLVSQPIRE